MTDRETLADKLRPDRFSAMSGKMAAIVGYGFVLAERSGEVGANEILGTEEDLNRNLVSLIEAAGLSDDEVAEFYFGRGDCKLCVCRVAVRHPTTPRGGVGTAAAPSPLIASRAVSALRTIARAASAQVRRARRHSAHTETSN